MSVGSGFGALLRIREFRGLQAAALVSVLGDQLARVALSVLVFQRTGSSFLTAVTYAVSFAPALVGGPLLSGLADRLPRRSVMIACDLGRAAIAALIAVPGVPLGVLLSLLFCVGLLSPPFAAARSGVLRAAVGSDSYAAASGFNQAVDQTAQLGGFALAGILVAATSPRIALVADALSFLVSAGFLVATVQVRPAAVVAGEGAQRSLLALAGRDAALGWRLLMGDPVLRRAVLLVWVGLAAAVVPEGLAAPWAAQLGSGARGVGLLLLANPLGTVPGLLLATRERRGVRHDPGRLMLILLAVTLIPLVACLGSPPLAGAVALIAVSGFGSAYITLAQVLVVRSVRDEHLGRVVGVAGTGLTVAQAVGVVVGGVVGDWFAAPHVVGGAALLAIATCAVVLVGTRAGAPVAGLPQR